MKHVSPLALALAAVSLSTLGCSSSDGEPTDTDQSSVDPNDMPPGNDPPATDPPGNEPPGNEPPYNQVDPELTDVCQLGSGWAGDEYCILPPAADEGIQLHVGPADYDDPDALAPYLVPAGHEDVVCFNDRAEQGGFYYLEQQNRMRPGSHHMLIGLNPADGLEEGPSSQCEGFGSLGSVPGSQTPARDFLNEDFAPEDQGLGRFFPENAMAAFQLHYVNTSDEPVLREAWINVYKKEEVTEKLNSIFLVGDLSVNVPPHTRQVTKLAYEPPVTEQTRIFEITGHSHAHNERFSVWRTHAGQRELLYESYDWAEPMVVRYNTIVQNPAPNPAALTDGGLSGVQHLEPGDLLEWECEVNNTTDAALRFANEAYTAEMCLLGGGYVGDQAGLLAGGCASGSCFGFGSRGVPPLSP